MPELKKELKAAGKTVLKGGRKEALHNMAKEAGIAIEVTEVDVEEGWEGAAKGSLQILWERGFLDPNVANIEAHHTTHGQLDGAGDPINETSLKWLMGQLHDFVHEPTMLQCVGEVIGVTADRMPKARCEMAGEGVERSWACGKMKHRCLPLDEKRSKEKFRANVSMCLWRECIATDRIRLFSRRARRHMVACHLLSKERKDGLELDFACPKAKDHIASMGDLSAPIKIEQLVKMVKNHRCAFDFDKKFISRIVDGREILVLAETQD
jgi:hypothetical protein